MISRSDQRLQRTEKFDPMPQHHRALAAEEWIVAPLDSRVLIRGEIGHHLGRRLPHHGARLLEQFGILERFLHNPNIDLIGEVKDHVRGWSDRSLKVSSRATTP